MSRSRPIKLPPEICQAIDLSNMAFDGEKYWFNRSRASERATSEQLELLAVAEDVDFDDLLDAMITQGDVLTRLRIALDQGPIPIEVLERRQRWREQRALQPRCRKCEKEGDSTRHHFVNKWILRELGEYTQKWAERSKNCIPLCIDCHRHLHFRDDEEAKSIADLLSPEEQEFAQAALSALAEERPKLLLLIARGDPGVYETRLVRDWIEGKFEDTPAPYARHLRAVS